MNSLEDVEDVTEPKKKYGPLGEARRKSDEVRATVECTSQLLRIEADIM